MSTDRVSDGDPSGDIIKQYVWRKGAQTTVSPLKDPRNEPHTMSLSDASELVKELAKKAPPRIEYGNHERSLMRQRAQFEEGGGGPILGDFATNCWNWMRLDEIVAAYKEAKAKWMYWVRNMPNFEEVFNSKAIGHEAFDRAVKYVNNDFKMADAT